MLKSFNSIHPASTGSIRCAVLLLAGLIVFNTGFLSVAEARQNAGQIKFGYTVKDAFTDQPIDSARVLVLRYGEVVTFGYTNADGFVELVITATSVPNAPQVPASFSLSDNYPNPFTENTSVDIALPEHQLVRAEVFNMLGQRVAGMQVPLNEGTYTLNFNLAHLSHGIYFLRITGQDARTVKMLKMGDGVNTITGALFSVQPGGAARYPAGGHATAGQPEVSGNSASNAGIGTTYRGSTGSGISTGSGTGTSANTNTSTNNITGSGSGPSNSTIAGTGSGIHSNDGLAGFYTIRAEKPPFADVEFEVEISADTSFNIGMDRLNQVVFNIRTDEGTPVNLNVKMERDGFAGSFPSNQTVILPSGAYSLSTLTDFFSPVQQSVEIPSVDTTFTIVVSEAPPGTPTGNVNVTGFVADADGDRLADVTVTLASNPSISGQTDADGRFYLANVPRGITQTFRFNKEGYSEQVFTTLLPSDLELGYIDITMLRRDDPVTLADAAAGGEISGRNGASVVIPANAIVDGSGNPVTGPVQVSVNAVDTGSDEVLAAPGSFTGNQAGERVSIATLGITEVLFEQNGTALALADGALVEVLIPVHATENLDGSTINPGDSYPVWRLDPETGIWTQTGDGVIEANPDPASSSPFVVRSTIDRSGWWGCYISYERAFVQLSFSVCSVTGSDGQNGGDLFTSQYSGSGIYATGSYNTDLFGNRISYRPDNRTGWRPEHQRLEEPDDHWTIGEGGYLIGPNEWSPDLQAWEEDMKNRPVQTADVANLFTNVTVRAVPPFRSARFVPRAIVSPAGSGPLPVPPGYEIEYIVTANNGLFDGSTRFTAEPFGFHQVDVCLAAVPFDPEMEVTGHLERDSVTTAALDPPGTVQLYTFDVEEGEILGMGIRRETGNFSGRATIVDPDGIPVISDRFFQNTAAPGVFTADKSGTWRVYVTSLGPNPGDISLFYKEACVSDDDCTASDDACIRDTCLNFSYCRDVSNQATPGTTADPDMGAIHGTWHGFLSSACSILFDRKMLILNINHPPDGSHITGTVELVWPEIITVQLNLTSWSNNVLTTSWDARINNRIENFQLTQCSYFPGNQNRLRCDYGTTLWGTALRLDLRRQ